MTDHLAALHRILRQLRINHPDYYLSREKDPISVGQMASGAETLKLWHEADEIMAAYGKDQELWQLMLPDLSTAPVPEPSRDLIDIIVRYMDHVAQRQLQKHGGAAFSAIELAARITSASARAVPAAPVEPAMTPTELVDSIRAYIRKNTSLDEHNLSAENLASHLMTASARAVPAAPVEPAMTPTELVDTIHWYGCSRGWRLGYDDAKDLASHLMTQGMKAAEKDLPMRLPDGTFPLNQKVMMAFLNRAYELLGASPQNLAAGLPQSIAINDRNVQRHLRVIMDTMQTRYEAYAANLKAAPVDSRDQLVLAVVAFLETGKRDLTNPKYDGYYQELSRLVGRTYVGPVGPADERALNKPAPGRCTIDDVALPTETEPARVVQPQETLARLDERVVAIMRDRATMEKAKASAQPGQMVSVKLEGDVAAMGAPVPLPTQRTSSASELQPGAELAHEFTSLLGKRADGPLTAPAMKATYVCLNPMCRRVLQVIAPLPDSARCAKCESSLHYDTYLQEQRERAGAPASATGKGQYRVVFLDGNTSYADQVDALSPVDAVRVAIALSGCDHQFLLAATVTVEQA